MQYSRRTFVLMFITSVSGAPVVMGQGPPGHARQRRRQRRRRKATQDRRRRHRGFSREQARIIRGYYSRRNSLPPGLSGRDRLPPGLRKQLRERGQLPPGLQKRIEPLPGDLRRRLPRLPGRYQRGVVGRDVILVDRERNIILDLLPDAF